MILVIAVFRSVSIIRSANVGDSVLLITVPNISLVLSFKPEVAAVDAELKLDYLLSGLDG